MNYPDLPRTRTTSSGHAVTGEFNFTKAVALKSISSWREASGHGAAANGTDELRGIGLVPSGAIAAYRGVAYSAPKEFGVKQFSQEVQLSGDIGEWSYSTGGFYFHESGYDNIHGRYLFALSPALGMTVNSITTYYVTNSSEAIYGQVGYTPGWMNDKLELTAGLRRTSDHKRANQTSPIIRTGDHTFDDTTWSFSVRYSWTPDVMMFARAGTGIRAGGFNIRAARVGQEFLFQPERATSYEVGAKTHFFDNRVRLNAGVFHTKYEDLQITTITGASTSGGIGGGTYNANATYRGGEIELAVTPLEGLVFSTNLGYVDPEYKKIIFPAPGTGIPTNYAREARFPYVAKLNGSLDAKYEVPISVGTLIASLNYSYMSKRYFHMIDIAGQNPLNNVLASRGEGILNGRVSVADFDIGNAKTEISVWVDNITDEFYRANGIDYGALGFAAATFSEPRTVGIDLKMAF